jgi:3-hydroxy-9,10-secoandrosta-1,3,5(10)-triene-9,17-dione monooxygenase
MAARSVTQETLLAKAAAINVEVRPRSQEIEELRNIPRDIMERVDSDGLLNLIRPKRFGGAEAPIEHAFATARTLAKGDASLAWVYAVISAHDLVVGHFPQAAQEAYWASDTPRCAASSIPSGKAVRVDGGYRLTGKWPYCSGIDFCSWAAITSIVGMRTDLPHIPDVRYFLAPKVDFTVVDDWFVTGLAGTGSKSIVLDDVFVPDERMMSNFDASNGVSPGSKLHDNPLYRAPMWAVWVFSLPALATGIAQGAYEVMREDMRARAAKPDPLFTVKKPATQIHLSQASALIRASDLLYSEGSRETFAEINAGRTLSLDQRMRNRRDTTQSVAMARDATTILYHMAGARGLSSSGFIQRAFRDIWAVAAHPGTNLDPALISFGGYELGDPPADMFY